MRILNVKENSVTRGVLDKTIQAEPDLIEITFVDDQNTAHTIHVHRDGPFTDPEDAVAAFYAGTIHDQPNPEPLEPPTTPQGDVGAGNYPTGG